MKVFQGEEELFKHNTVVLSNFEIRSLSKGEQASFRVFPKAKITVEELTSLQALDDLEKDSLQREKFSKGEIY